MEENKHYIYKLIMSLINKDGVKCDYFYIGVTKRPELRLRQHINTLKNNTHDSYLQDHFNDKTNKDITFSMEIIDEVISDDILIRLEVERQHIVKFDGNEFLCNKKWNSIYEEEYAKARSKLMTERNLSYYNDEVFGEVRRLHTGEVFKNKWKCPEFREKMKEVSKEKSKLMKRYWKDPIRRKIFLKERKDFRKVVVEGVNYKTLYDASKALNVTPRTVKLRIISKDIQWLYWIDEGYPKDPKELDTSRVLFVGSKLYFSISDLSRDIKIDKSTLGRHIKKGYMTKYGYFTWGQHVELFGEDVTIERFLKLLRGDR